MIGSLSVAGAAPLARMRVAGLAVGLVLALVLWAGVEADGAAAALPVTTKFSTPGPSSFTVPTGVARLTVTATGAAGAGCFGSSGGKGATVTATVPVSPNEQLFIEVGGTGSNGGGAGGTCVAAGGAGGIGGGGHGGSGESGHGNTGGAGGGGASLVGPGSGSPIFSGLLVVAGGGGGGAYALNGGDAGVAGANAFLARGGGAGTQVSGGVGGAQEPGGNATAGTSGTALEGGAGGSGGTNGQPGAGGGGGGYYGGGGGGGSVVNGAGSGGGGSSYVTASASAVAGPTSSSSAAGVTITYTVADPPTASISSPVSGGPYWQGQSVPTSFSCTEGANGSVMEACTDTNGTVTTSGGSGHLDTSVVGTHTYKVTATSADGFTGTTSISYTVVALPSATITSPASGSAYLPGASAPTSFSCAEAENGPGIESCDDSNGTSTTSGGSGKLDTSVVGTHTYEVTATSKDGGTKTTSITYTIIGPPTATLTSPSSGGTYELGQSVPTNFGCAESSGGPGLTSCDDSNGTSTTSGGSGELDTSVVGTHTYKVTATSKDGGTRTTSITYTIIGPPTATLISPSSGGTYELGQSVPTNFGCAEASGGPGLTSCADSNGVITTSGGSGHLDTSMLGTHTYKVTATSADAYVGTTSITYTVNPVPVVVPTGGTGTGTGTTGGAGGTGPAAVTTTSPVPKAAPAPPQCLVPNLKGKKLEAAKKKLAAADCKLGKVTKGNGASAKSGKVTKQGAKPGKSLAAGTKVSLTLG